MSGGFLGVDVFFVLSGYLTGSIALSGRYGLGEFMIRRLLRVWPLLLCVSVVVAGFLAAQGVPFAPQILPGAFYLGNLTARTGLMAHTWSLATEVQFYSLLAVGAALLPGDRALRIVAATLFVAVTAARFSFVATGNWDAAYSLPITHSSGLFLGVLIATLPLERLPRAPSVFAVSLVAILGAFTLSSRLAPEALLSSIPFTEVASALLIASIASGAGSVAAVLRSAPMSYLGRISYGIYLWHYPIVIVLRRGSICSDPGEVFSVALSLSIVLAALTHRYVEYPARTLVLARTSG
jgi:peptidoglycan/LPS O-acetylase OafA/YrhL